MTPEKTLKLRLAKYTAAALAVGTVSDANATIVYTDITPDFSGGLGSQYLLDLNNDGTDDFRFYHSFGNLYVQPLASNNDILGSVSYYSAYPFALNAGDPISASGMTWNNQAFSSGYQSLNLSGSTGNFIGVTDAYMGVRFDDGNGNILYGWVRLDVSTNAGMWVVKDYAYEDNGSSIPAGAMPMGANAVPATNIVGMDIANNSNGMDLQITMDASMDETTLSEYRLMAVKAANASTFNLASALGVAMANYTAVTPNGSSNYTQVLTATSTDTDGDAIVIDEPYRIFVLNVADGTNATMDVLSQAAMDVTLNTQANAATGVTGLDVANNMNGSDAQINFTAAMVEANVQEYRIMIVKDANAGAFNLAAAQAVAMADYTAVTPTGASSYSEILAATATDVDGDAIANNVDYVAFVMSLQNGITSNLDSLSQGSATFVLDNFDNIKEPTLTDVEAFVYGEELKIQLGASHASQLKAILLISDGKLVSEFTVNPGSNNQNLSTLARGVYILRIADTSGKIFTHKFVK